MTTPETIAKHAHDNQELHAALHGVTLDLPTGDRILVSAPTIGDFTHYTALLRRWGDGESAAFTELMEWLVERLGDELKTVPIDAAFEIANAFFASRRRPTRTAPPKTTSTAPMTATRTGPPSHSSISSSSSATPTAGSPAPTSPGSSSPKGSSVSVPSTPAGSSSP